MRTRAIYGCAGTELLAQERGFFADAKPWGFILFSRNIADRDQTRRLIASLRATVDDPQAPILIDQEGGRVARLPAPQWKKRPPSARFGALHEVDAEAAREAVYLNARLIAHDLSDLGINVNCMPVLDVPVENANDVIGDRALSRDPAIVVELGRLVIEGMLEGGVLPVMKHIPGHGRAMADSHLALPRVEAPREILSMSDFVTFRGLADCPMAMTAHVVYEEIDPERPATTSSRVIAEVIRSEIGFRGLLMTDDLSMKALQGSIAKRAKAAQFAGCDIILHCNGGMSEMLDVAKEAKALDDVHLKRAETALARLVTPEDIDIDAGEERLATLLKAVQ